MCLVFNTLPCFTYYKLEKFTHMKTIYAIKYTRENGSSDYYSLMYFNKADAEQRAANIEYSCEIIAFGIV